MGAASRLVLIASERGVSAPVGTESASVAGSDSAPVFGGSHGLLIAAVYPIRHDARNYARYMEKVASFDASDSVHFHWPKKRKCYTVLPVWEVFPVNDVFFYGVRRFDPIDPEQPVPLL